MPRCRNRLSRCAAPPLVVALAALGAPAAGAVRAAPAAVAAAAPCAPAAAMGEGAISGRTLGPLKTWRATVAATGGPVSAAGALGPGLMAITLPRRRAAQVNLPRQRLSLLAGAAPGGAWAQDGVAVLSTGPGTVQARSASGADAWQMRGVRSLRPLSGGLALLGPLAVEVGTGDVVAQLSAQALGGDLSDGDVLGGVCAADTLYLVERIAGQGGDVLVAVSLATGEPLWNVPLDAAARGARARPLSVVAIPSGALVSVPATSGPGSIVTLYAAGSGRGVWSAQALGGVVSGGEAAAFMARDGSIAAVDAATGAPLWQRPAPGASAVLFASTRDLLVSEGNRLAVISWAGGPVASLPRPPGTLAFTQVAGDAYLLAIARGAADRLTMVELARGTPRARYAPPTVDWQARLHLNLASAPAAVALAPDGADILLAPRATPDLEILSAATGQLLARIALPAPATGLSLSADGAYAAITLARCPDMLAGCTDGGAVSVVDLAAGTAQSVAVGTRPRAVAFTSTGSEVAVGTQSGSVSLIPVTDPPAATAFSAGTAPVTALAFTNLDTDLVTVSAPARSLSAFDLAAGGAAPVRLFTTALGADPSWVGLAAGGAFAVVAVRFGPRLEAVSLADGRVALVGRQAEGAGPVALDGASGSYLAGAGPRSAVALYAPLSTAPPEPPTEIRLTPLPVAGAVTAVVPAMADQALVVTADGVCAVNMATGAVERALGPAGTHPLAAVAADSLTAVVVSGRTLAVWQGLGPP